MAAIKKPTAPPNIIPHDGPALRVTSPVVESDGGSFTMTLGEYRAVDSHAPNERNADGKSAVVQLGRYSFSATAFVHLKNAMAQAEASHVKHFGPLPDVVEYQARLEAEVGPMFVPPVTPRVGLRTASMDRGSAPQG